MSFDAVINQSKTGRADEVDRYGKIMRRNTFISEETRINFMKEMNLAK
jgi:hypothetical protein